MSQDAAEWHGMDQAASQCQDLPSSTAVGAGDFPCPPGRECETKDPPKSLLPELPKCGGQGTAWSQQSWMGLSCWALG